MAQPMLKKIGKYEVMQRLGGGGMGAVYKARDPQLNRMVAIKMLAVGITGDPSFQERFFREATATAHLSHPNIVTIYDLGEQEGCPYLVMEFIEGSTLDGVVANRELDLGQKLSIVLDVCHGLEYAHQRGIVHRDIKPGNVMVLADGSAKIVDFGIAHMGNADVTRAGMVIGTLNYMSPEQIQAVPVDGRADIFSTGVVLYQLLTGCSPFDGGDPASTLYRILHDDPRPFTEFLSSYPPELETITFKALAKRREDRYESAADFAQDISRVNRALPYAMRPAAIKRLPAAPPPRPMVTGPVGVSQSVPGPAPFPPKESLPQTGSVTVLATRPVPTRVLASDAEAASEEHGAGALTSDATCIFTRGAPGAEGGHTLPRVRLTFTAANDGLLFGKSVVVSSVPFRIGRNADLSINDAHLSREHAVINWDGKSFTISDLGSTNGTYVNGRRLPAGLQTLPFGAVIRLGTATALTFSSDEICELPDLAGQRITNRYLLTKILRNGTKTALYEASDSRLPQKVAVKILSPSLAGYPGYLEHFNREAEIAAGLHHPHICQVLDYGQASVRIGAQPLVPVNYLCAELMEGGSLTDRVAQGTPIELPQIVSWLNDITNALESAHRQGVTHGGLKLSSIVFDREGEPYVTDFAMACRVDDQAQPVFIGSPEFLAPEQWEGAAPTALSDQYSLGALTYLLLAGSCPFEGQIDPKVRERNFVRGAVPVHEEAARVSRKPVPPRISEVLNRALSVTPANRYTSVREFFLALQSAVSDPASRREGPARIFISYQRDSSSGWAVHFASELDRKHQIAAFVDTQRMDSAVRFPARLKRAIQDCDVFVCLLSGSTLQSKWVQEEIRLAWEKNKPMVPVFQESYSQPDPSEHLEPHIEALINYDGVKLLDRQNLYVENAIEKLAEMVTESVRRSGRAPAE
jgi:serine/threonine protein kinase